MRRGEKLVRVVVCLSLPFLAGVSRSESLFQARILE